MNDLYLYSLDDQSRDILRAGRGWTMCAPLQQHFVLDSTRHIVESDRKGAIVECGVWRGGMMQIAARTALAYAGDVSRLPSIWLFDTFEGMPAPESVRDRDLHNGVHAVEHLARAPKVGPDGQHSVWCVADLADVRAGMESVGYPADLVHFVPGRVEETIPSHGPDEIALLRVDTDWEGSTRHVLDALFDRVVSGGMIAFDDYESWEGARYAVDDFFSSRGMRPMLTRLDKGRVYIKP